MKWCNKNLWLSSLFAAKFQLYTEKPKLKNLKSRTSAMKERTYMQTEDVSKWSDFLCCFFFFGFKVEAIIIIFFCLFHLIECLSLFVWCLYFPITINTMLCRTQKKCLKIHLLLPSHHHPSSKYLVISPRRHLKFTLLLRFFPLLLLEKSSK